MSCGECWAQKRMKEEALAEVERLREEVKRLKEREGTLLEIIASTETELNEYAKLYSKGFE